MKNASVSLDCTASLLYCYGAKGKGVRGGLWGVILSSCNFAMNCCPVDAFLFWQLTHLFNTRRTAERPFKIQIPGPYGPHSCGCPRWLALSRGDHWAGCKDTSNRHLQEQTLISHQRTATHFLPLDLIWRSRRPLSSFGLHWPFVYTRQEVGKCLKHLWKGRFRDQSNNFLLSSLQLKSG